jgi:hypothetical protein
MDFLQWAGDMQNLSSTKMKTTIQFYKDAD